MALPQGLTSFANKAWPFAAGALLMVGCYLAYDRFGKHLPSFTRGGGAFVMVDVVRIVNAQNRLAVSSLGSDADALTRATRAGSLIEQTIREVAGAGTIVLVKQGVVAPEASTQDITDEVLRRLALPLDAPTVDVMDRAGYSPGPATNFSGSAMERVLDEAVASKRAATAAGLAESRAEQSQALIP